MLNDNYLKILLTFHCLQGTAPVYLQDPSSQIYSVQKFTFQNKFPSCHFQPCNKIVPLLSRTCPNSISPVPLLSCPYHFLLARTTFISHMSHCYLARTTSSPPYHFYLARTTSSSPVPLLARPYHFYLAHVPLLSCPYHSLLAHTTSTSPVHFYLARTTSIQHMCHFFLAHTHFAEVRSVSARGQYVDLPLNIFLVVSYPFIYLFSIAIYLMNLIKCIIFDLQ